jgi:hypothetical protein
MRAAVLLFAVVAGGLSACSRSSSDPNSLARVGQRCQALLPSLEPGAAVMVVSTTSLSSARESREVSARNWPSLAPTTVLARCGFSWQARFDAAPTPSDCPSGEEPNIVVAHSVRAYFVAPDGTSVVVPGSEPRTSSQTCSPSQ